MARSTARRAAPTSRQPGRQPAATPRVTVTTLPSLDPVRADTLGPFWETLFRIAQRVAAQSPATPVAA